MIQLVTGNINLFASAGSFETDRSTWGFGNNNAGLTFDRSSSYAKSNTYAARVLNAPVTGGFAFTRSTCVPAKFRARDGRKYVLRAWVYTPVGQPLVADTSVQISINATGYVNTNYSRIKISETRKTLLECTGVWQQLEAKIEMEIDESIYPTGIDEHVYICLLPDGSEYTNHTGTFAPGGIPYNAPPGYIFIDDFEVFEYIDVEDTCDLAFDLGNCVITDESTPLANDGSIELAGTGGDGDLEYSIDDGETYQSSPLFEDLSTGVYHCRIREVENPTCVVSYSFSINSEAADFEFICQATHESLPDEEDGTITVIVTGSTGPYEYSKNGGVGYQAENLFENLAPGTYTIAVKDSNDVVQVLNVLIEPGSLVYDRAYFSKNPIPLSVGAQVGYEALNNYRVYCDTRVEVEAGSGEFVSQLKQELEPDETGVAVFNLRQAFRKVLEAVPTEKVTELLILTDRIKLFKTYTGHLEDDDITPGVLTPSLPMLVLLGGIDKLNFPGLAYLTDYLAEHKKFLTWAPLEKDVDREQEDYLNFFVHQPLVNVISERCKIYYDDDTDETVTLMGASGIVQGQLIQFPVGPANTTVLLYGIEKNVLKYDIWLEDQDDNVISEVRTFILSSYHHPLTRFLMILNSLGSWEVHKFTGQAESTEAYNRTTVQKFLPSDYEALDGEVEIRDVMSAARHSFSSGYIKGKYAADWLNYMREIARSKMLYEITAVGTRIPMLNTTRDFTFKRDQNYERYIRIDAQEVYDNESFTPEL